MARSARIALHADRDTAPVNCFFNGNYFLCYKIVTFVHENEFVREGAFFMETTVIFYRFPFLVRMA